ncbi:O-antigen ligase family protein [Xylophilus rhododendri]|uniref:O-antigen ligase family protein n=1 Tax=Xylophilus rhododendri TaxID=2697032 RepID=A0A857J9H3_9BURK|nr:O-antigen ligase family protein [Xylophilus rhododendri]QHI99873.1 O-antigen ligase family protein [Xylophilus rhododendri]
MNTAADTAPSSGGGIAAPLELWLIRALVAFSFVFCFLPSNFTWTYDEQDFDFTQGSIATQLEFGSIFLAGVWLAWRHADWTLLRLRQANLFLFLFVGFAVLSAAWSGYPMVTLKRSAQLVGFLIVGIAIAPPVGGSRQVLQVLMCTLTVLLVLSLFTVVLNPRVGIDTMLGNAWRGLFLQKNTTGQAAAICALLWLREGFEARWLPRPACVLALLFSLFMLVMAKSSTSLLVFCIGSLLYVVMRRQYVVMRQPWWLIGLTGCVLLGLAVHLFYVLTGHLPGWDDIAGSIGALFGKDSDLTGRTDIWELVLREVRQHPVMGTGYGAFWLGLEGPAEAIARALYWIPLQSHNGYLDIVNELGFVGLGLALCVFARHAVLLGRLLQIDREEGAMHCVIFVLILISNMTESEIFRGSLFYNILFLYSACSVASQVALAGQALTDDEGTPARPVQGLA